MKTSKKFPLTLTELSALLAANVEQEVVQNNQSLTKKKDS
ncbi:Protein of unknown function [Lactobacillus hominis DSM 23910 = CRBIP 24.179]|uniref:Uncharacterized protein n=1 Tax=Lactobacillus hominis DSM 23910 = CRBIP 24.179 TaxID=1423758 RepID=I7LAF7_9LACO|nr:Protein of unknown function [Lactobacillus hominis DSM 23910 = CRBIP 24.179]